MKATVKSIEYQDFKGVSNRKVKFSEGQNFINLPNRSGKTSMYDGFMWVMVGKDSEQSSRFRVEPYGMENPKTKVTVTLDVDGSEVILSKEPGKWTYNGLEVKKNVFDDFLSNIQTVENLELLSNPKAFMSLHWETRRNLLTGMFCEKVSEDSEFSFLMKSMSISDIRKSKTKQKADANKGLSTKGIVIETHEATLKALKEIDFTILKNELEQKENELEALSKFDWNDYYRKDTLYTSGKKDFGGLKIQYENKTNSLKIEEESRLEDSKGCPSCGSKISQEKFDELKANRIKKINEDIEDLKTKLIEQKEKNVLLKADFDAADALKPDESIPLKLSNLKAEISALQIKIAKENDISDIQTKIDAEQKQLDAYAKEVMDIEAFMDRFATFLTDNYYKSINDNFDGLFFDIENECKLTNDNGVEFKDFSTSEKINAGVQIISVISKKIGLRFPLWVDDRESVTNLYPIDTQVINLKVV